MSAGALESAMPARAGLDGSGCQVRPSTGQREGALSSLLGLVRTRLRPRGLRPVAVPERNLRVVLELALFLMGGVFLVDLIDEPLLPPLTPLPAAPYAISILVAAYALPPRMVAMIAAAAMAVQLLVAWNHDAALWSTTLEQFSLLFIGYLATELSAKTRREVTLKAEAEASLGKLQAVVESMAEGVMIFDLEGKIVGANQAAQAMHGCRGLDRILGRSPGEFARAFELRDLEGRSMAGAESPLARVLRGEVLSDYLARVDRLDTGGHWIGSFSGRPVRSEAGEMILAVLTMRDITEQKKAEAALRESEERFRLIVTNSPDLIYHQDCALRYTWIVNPISPLAEEDVVGKTDFDLFGGEEAERLTACKRKVLATGVGARIESRLTIGGREHDVDAAIEPRRDCRGRIVGIAGYVRDVTERKRAQAQLMEQRRSVAILQERERLARELHDSLGQVLCYVNTEAQAARKLLSRGETATAGTYLARLVSVAQDAHADVREFIGGVKSAALAERGFFPALDQYLQRFGQNHGIITELVVPPELLVGAFEPVVEVQLLRIIQEALTNVRKHACALRARVDFAVQEGRVQVVVEDDGRGFDPGLLSGRVGQSFGLHIMRERAEEVGGSLQVHSAPDQGTRVVVRVPLRKEARSRVDEGVACR